MKIKRLKLVNFIGILHGLDRDEIELDFSQSKNVLVMLRGGNGSGKSTIMSQLHPFKDSFDDRKTIIVDGKEGIKEIDIEHNGHLYEIKHIYGEAQSFFKKDGVELNENGAVKGCKELIKTELGITDDYFKIGKIGSNTKNFVDFPTSERKNYIGRFLNIEEIISKYKIANTKLGALKKDIDSVSSELSKYEQEDVLEAKIKALDVSLEEIENTLADLLSEQGALTTQIAINESEIGERSMTDLTTRQNELMRSITQNTTTKESVESDITDLSDIETKKEKLQSEILELQSDLRVNSFEINSKTLLLVDYKNKISATELELAGLGDPEKIKKLKDEVISLESELEEIRAKIKASDVSALINSMQVAKKDVGKFTNKFKEFTDTIELYFSDLQKQSFNNSLNIELFLREDFEESLSRQITESRKVLKDKQDLLTAQETKRGVKEGHVCQLKNLEKRPAECTIDSCPFIKEAYLHRNVLSEIQEVDAEIQQTKKDIELLSVKAGNIQDLQNKYIVFREAYKNVLPRENDVLIHFLKVKSLSEWVAGPLAEFQKSRQELLSSISDSLQDFDDFLTLRGKIKTYEQHISSANSEDSKLREKYERDLAEYIGLYEKLSADINELTEKTRTLSGDITVKQTILDAYNEYITACSKLDSDSIKLSEIESEVEELKKIIDSKNTSTTRLNIVKSDITRLTNDKTQKTLQHRSISTTLSKVQDLREKLNKLNEEYKPTAAVAKALSVSTGIPLILIQLHLEETEKIANDLLSIAYGGDFSIKFVTTEKEFSIQVSAKNNIKPDIKMASQGEIALTTISVSLALIEQSVGEYNILCLDEMDGNLDPENREKFTTLLNKQIEKLGIEQVFIISHNDAFDSAEMDLVLLKGNGINQENTEFMNSKTVIFDYNK